MTHDDNSYRIRNLVYDVAICDQVAEFYPEKIPPDQLAYRIKLTATARDEEGNPPPTPLPVYWSCPRSAVMFSDADGNIITSSLTNPETGQTTVYACCFKPALAKIAASLDPNPYNLSAQYLVRVVFCNIAAYSGTPFAAPEGSSNINIPQSSQDIGSSYAYNFHVVPNSIAEELGYVAAWTAQIDEHNNVVAKDLLFPVYTPPDFVKPPPEYWVDLYTRGIDVPYQNMKSDDSTPSYRPNVVQYLYQERWEYDASPSGWFRYDAAGVAWVQPDPNRAVNSDYPRPLLWNPITNREMTQEQVGVITNEILSSDGKEYWLIFKIHPDTLNAGDLIYPWIYANGYEYATSVKKSYYTNVGEYLVETDDDGQKLPITVMIPAGPLTAVAEGSGGRRGSLTITYQVNQREWSLPFRANTQFMPVG
jgi:hypothetical protein